MKNKEIYGSYSLEITKNESIEELIDAGFYRLYAFWIKEKSDQFKNLVDGVTKGKARFTIIVPERELLFDDEREELCLKYKQYGRPATLLELAFFGAYFPLVQTKFLALFALGSSIKDECGDYYFPYLSYEKEDDGRMNIAKIPRKRGLKLCSDVYDVYSVHSPTGVIFVKWNNKKLSKLKKD
jgi:hypothetical protein